MSRLVSVLDGSRVRLRESEDWQDPLVLAAMLRAAIASGQRAETVARKAGRSRPWVANMIRLLALGPEAKAALRAGQITVAQAKLLVAMPSVEQARIVGLAVRRKWTYRRLADETSKVAARVRTRRGEVLRG